MRVLFYYEAYSANQAASCYTALLAKSLYFDKVPPMPLWQENLVPVLLMKRQKLRQSNNESSS